MLDLLHFPTKYQLKHQPNSTEHSPTEKVIKLIYPSLKQFYATPPVSKEFDISEIDDAGAGHTIP